MGYGSKEKPVGYVAVKHALGSAVKAKILQGREAHVVNPNDGEYYPDDDLALIRVDAIKDWLRSKGVVTHFFFFPEEPEGEFLSSQHPRYSPKLAAAIRAWQAMEGKDLKGKTPKQSVIKWLRLHGADYDLTDDDGKPLDTVIDEIAKIVNWKPQGGAPKTPTGAGSTKPTGVSKALAAIDQNFQVTAEKKIDSIEKLTLIWMQKFHFK
ncbi:hypothetical protein [Litorimonas sp. WD9-15]|uniref:hypothetical protein n=1 Tax=Litorimonas sp. WD9-15 TaxID=3418716 RepID=UPI003D068967